MTGLYIIFGGLVLFASFFGVMDLLAERRERHATERRWRS